jgi:hypothetical protein
VRVDCRAWSRANATNAANHQHAARCASAAAIAGDVADVPAVTARHSADVTRWSNVRCSRVHRSDAREPAYAASAARRAASTSRIDGICSSAAIRGGSPSTAGGSPRRALAHVAERLDGGGISERFDR